MTKTVAIAPWTSNPTYGVCHRGWIRANATGSAPSTPATYGSRAEPASHAPTPPRFPRTSRMATIAATGASQPAPSRSTRAAVACGMPFVMLTVSCGSATSMAAVPRTYMATIASPDTAMPRRNVRAGSWISSPSVGASSSPAKAKVIVANRLMDCRSRVAGRRPRAVTGVALPCAASDQSASSTNTSPGSQVPCPPRFCSRFPTRRPTTFIPTASHSPVSDTRAMNTLSSPRCTKRGPAAYAAMAAVATRSDGK